MSESGELAGSVSGGCVESDVVLAAQEVLGGGAPRLLTYGITDDMALEIGLPVRRRDRRLRRAARVSLFDELRRGRRVRRPRRRPHGHRRRATSARSSSSARTASTAGDGPHELAALAPAALRTGRSHVIEHDGTTVFADVFGPPPRLLVYGAVDTAEALCRAREAARLDDDRRRRARPLRDARARPERRRAPRRLARRGARARRSPTSAPRSSSSPTTTSSTCRC